VQTGLVVLKPSLSGFDPEQTSGTCFCCGAQHR